MFNSLFYKLIIIPLVYTYDKTCTQCYGEKGYCLDKTVVNAESEDDFKKIKSQYRQFYDCTKGGKTETVTYAAGGGVTAVITAKYCQFKPNSKYYAVIIVPVLAFSFALIGLAYYLIKVRKSSYSPPPENKSVEMTTGTV